METVQKTGRPRDRARAALSKYLLSPSCMTDSISKQRPEQPAEAVINFSLDELEFQETEIMEQHLTSRLILTVNDVQKQFVYLMICFRCRKWSSKRSTYFSWISCHWWFRSWKSPKRLHGSAGDVLITMPDDMVWCAFYINRFSFAYPSFSHNEFSLCRLWKNR